MSEPSLSPEKFLKQFEEAVAACNRCGFCTSYCPTYNATGLESYSPRGRNQTVRSIIEGKLDNPEDARAIIDTCLLCGECTSVCFSEVPTANLMVHARHFLNEKKGIPKALDFFLKTILPHRRLFGLALKVAFLGKRLGLAALASRLGLLRRFAPVMETANELMTDVPVKFLLDYAETRPNQLKVKRLRDQNLRNAEKKVDTMIKKADTVPEQLMRTVSQPRRPMVAYMPACGSQYLNPQIGLSTLRLFRKLGFDFVIPETICCGLPAASYGVLDRVKVMARKNMKRLEQGRYEAIVGDDSSCQAHLQEYAKFFEGDADGIRRAHALEKQLRDVSTFLVERGLLDVLRKSKWTGGPVAYHDPCKSQYGLKITAPPRRLLTAIPGLKLVDIPESDQCCGGGGTYSFVHPGISREVLDRKMANIKASGAKVVLTSSASCLVQLQYGARRAKADIEFLHLTEFLWSVVNAR